MWKTFVFCGKVFLFRNCIFTIFNLVIHQSAVKRCFIVLSLIYYSYHVTSNGRKVDKFNVGSFG